MRHKATPEGLKMHNATENGSRRVAAMTWAVAILIVRTRVFIA